MMSRGNRLGYVFSMCPRGHESASEPISRKDECLMRSLAELPTVNKQTCICKHVKFVLGLSPIRSLYWIAFSRDALRIFASPRSRPQHLPRKFDIISLKFLRSTRDIKIREV